MESVLFTPPLWDDLVHGIRRYAGTPLESENRANVPDQLPRLIIKALASIAPRSTIKKTDISNCTANILRGEKISIASSKLCSLLSAGNKPFCIVGFALTMGKQIDTLITETQKKSMAEAMIVDACATFLTEHYANLIENHVRKKLGHKGLVLSARFSPGYCDWDLQHGQAELAGFLETYSIGIETFFSGAMLPLKSVTGIFVAAVSLPSQTPCAWCRDHGCCYRR